MKDKIVIFDLDETLGYFSQISTFWVIIKNHLLSIKEKHTNNNATQKNKGKN